MNRGDLPARKSGGRTLILVEDLRKYVEALPRRTTTAENLRLLIRRGLVDTQEHVGSRCGNDESEHGLQALSHLCCRLDVFVVTGAVEGVQ